MTAILQTTIQIKKPFMVWFYWVLFCWKWKFAYININLPNIFMLATHFHASNDFQIMRHVNMSMPLYVYTSDTFSEHFRTLRCHPMGFRFKNTNPNESKL